MTTGYVCTTPAARRKAVVCATLVYVVPFAFFLLQPVAKLPRMTVKSPPAVFELAPLQALQSKPNDLRIDDTRQKQEQRKNVQPVDEPDMDRTQVTKADHSEQKRQEHSTTQPQVIAEAERQQVEDSAAPPTVSAPLPAVRTTAPVAGASAAAAEAQRTWEAHIAAMLERAKRFPVAARWSGAQDTVLVRIAVARDGKVRDTRILRSRGFSPLDEEARNLPRRVSPLPPPPDEIPGDPVIITVPIQFYLN